MRIATLLRKPCEVSTINSVLTIGTGAIQIDAIRIGVDEWDVGRIKTVGGWNRLDWSRPDRDRSVYGGGKGILKVGTLGEGMYYHSEGRWPANVILVGNVLADVCMYEEPCR